jgi:hypothetical protein
LIIGLTGRFASVSHRKKFVTNMALASVADLRALKDKAVVIDVRPPHEVHESGVKVDG